MKRLFKTAALGFCCSYRTISYFNNCDIIKRQKCKLAKFWPFGNWNVMARDFNISWGRKGNHLQGETIANLQKVKIYNRIVKIEAWLNLMISDGFAFDWEKVKIPLLVERTNICLFRFERYFFLGTERWWPSLTINKFCFFNNNK